MKSIDLARLVIGLILAAPTLVAAQESPNDKAAPAKSQQIVPKDLLKALVGSWEGTSRTWLQPGKLSDESKVKGKIQPMRGGRIYRHDYEGTIQGRPRHGEETIAFSSMAKRFQVSWVDSFHMTDATLFSEGEPTARGFIVKGKFEAGPNSPPW